MNALASCVSPTVDSIKRVRDTYLRSGWSSALTTSKSGASEVVLFIPWLYLHPLPPTTL